MGTLIYSVLSTLVSSLISLAIRWCATMCHGMRCRRHKRREFKERRFFRCIPLNNNVQRMKKLRINSICKFACQWYRSYTSSLIVRIICFTSHCPSHILRCRPDIQHLRHPRAPLHLRRRPYPRHPQSSPLYHQP
ncbi:hypothetical protein NEOLEDRAFT_172404 [Neolentinus lepideus HHB14362 ss-1]|uniref:Uncharacterized protein n=1 Tax=Neolentinus lepideus HHB14362 ss-1 TaxID=1314782 RepID=A0A165MIX2_9AGAM|nr:hypothetical protein NEOLEDRAFT_172404 [Neolentinus lepideus HHB14362 ss-1]